MKLDLNLLPVACVLYEERSVSRAAARLGKSQPAVSRALQRLRRMLGDPLFVKTRGGVEPTAKAMVFVACAREALLKLQRGVRSSSDFKPATYDGRFTIATTEAAESWLWPEALKKLWQLAPLSSYRLLRIPPNRIPLELENGSIDLALGFFAGLHGNNLLRQGILRIGPICLIRANHPIRGKKLTVKQFNNLGHIVVDSIGRNLIVDQILGQYKIHRKVALITSGYACLAPIITTSDLVVTIPRALGMRLAASNPRLRVIEPPVHIPPVLVTQYWHRKLHNDARNMWLRSVLKQIISEQHEVPEGKVKELAAS